MRLIGVAAILGIDASIDQGKEVDTITEIFGEFYGPDLEEKEYAILSHCWGVEKQGEKEVSLREMEQFGAMSAGKKNEIRRRTGYKKVIDTCRQAQKDGLEWVWIDTCCIDKKSSSELSEAINSMYKWYENAKLCYAYLHDTVGDTWTKPTESMTTPKWFSRGWTLQELIAPKVVHFLDRKWERIGDKAELAGALSKITRIPQKVLKEGLQKALNSRKDWERLSIAQIISWAADRTTTREEDRAYSLLGLLDVHMPMLYGEGKNAFRRLQLEIIRTSNDQSIFAWGCDRRFGWSSSILADDPSCFRDCDEVTAWNPKGFTSELREHGMADDELSKCTQERLRTFTVTNDGIQIWLPTATFGPYTEVTLACWHPYFDGSTTILLVICGSTCLRVFGDIPSPKYPGKLEFKQHFLPYKETKYPSPFTFELQVQTLSHDGFVLDCVYPDGIEVKDGSPVTLSTDNDFAAVAYVRKQDETCFLQDPESLRSRAFERLFNSNHEPTYRDKHLMQHIHFRQSIEGVRVVHRETRDSSVRCAVTIDIAKCAGCCTPEERFIDYLVETPRMPGLMWNCLEGKLPQARDMPWSLMESELRVTMAVSRKAEISSGRKAISSSLLQVLDLTPSKMTSVAYILQS
ncbi:heterokaryon incompatibility protein-domain-containing protein [Pisolithus marmoratus]|nr:heterokaryon incompatibility protein-domain-containing protein [Pisolithus marmoratus]